MARSQTSRFGLWRWSSDSDTQGRSDFDSDNNQLETLALIGLRGTLAARPAAGIRERLYYATDVRALYWDSGSTWKRTPGQVVQAGILPVAFSSDSAKTGTLSFPDSFTAPPVVQITVHVGSNLDILVNLTSAPSTTDASWRAFQKSGASVTGAVNLHWVAVGTVD